MSKCPYCNYELHLEDFFHVTTTETKKGKIKKKIGDFKGEQIKKNILAGVTGISRIWVCPSCDKILNITEFAYKWSG